VESAREQQRLVNFFGAVASELGRPVSGHATVLDFGCGQGEAVETWRAAGHDAFGCDMVLDRSKEPSKKGVPPSPRRLDLLHRSHNLEHMTQGAVVSSGGRDDG